ncbi:MAG: FAD-dependent oxidoreductase [Chloroflexi bacterium]|nr:FAD-dependent oxidoreductase [Chloroflexota bacterium]
MNSRGTVQVKVQRSRSHDVVVVGGGTTGFAAALASARNGADTALVEYNSFVGGNAANGLPFLGSHNQQKQLVVKGTALELIRRLQSVDAASDYYWDPITSDLVWINPDWLKVMAMTMLDEAGVHLYLRSLASGVDATAGHLNGLFISNKEGCQRLVARAFVDATDTADIAVLGGADYIRGRARDGRVQAASLCVRVGSIDFTELLQYYDAHPDEIRPWPLPREVIDQLLKQMHSAPFVIGGLRSLVAQAVAEGLEFPRDQVNGVCHPLLGEAILVASRVEDVDPNNVLSYTASERTGQLQVAGILEFVRRYMPGGCRARLIGTGHQIGVRETRHVLGGYTLTVDDLLQGRRFEDTVALGAYHVDIHSPDHKGLAEFVQPPTYGIPYRSLLPQNMDNLLVAGRCISATHEAQASTRVIPICMAIGQAAGTAAALSVRLGVTPRILDVTKLQRSLGKQGAELGDTL